MVDDASTQAQELLRIVITDPHLASGVHGSARALATMRSANPNLVLMALDALHAATAPTLNVAPSTLRYARFVPIAAFWQYNLSTVAKRRFATPTDYSRHIQTSLDPALELMADLGPQLLAPAANSWLVPLRNVAGLTGIAVKRALIISPPPPYVVMILPVAKMVSANVQVRDPRGVDAIPYRLTQWRSGNVSDEQIDRDIPRAALGRLEWWP